MGGDVGVFMHGDNAGNGIDGGIWYEAVGMYFRSATAVNADVFGINAAIGRMSVRV